MQQLPALFAYAACPYPPCPCQPTDFRFPPPPPPVSCLPAPACRLALHVGVRLKAELPNVHPPTRQQRLLLCWHQPPALYPPPTRLCCIAARVRQSRHPLHALYACYCILQQAL